MIKIEFHNENYVQDVYIEGCECGAEELIHDVRGFVSKFKTYCIENKKPYNIPHFVNWMNKYTNIECSTKMIAEDRIDL